MSLAARPAHRHSGQGYAALVSRESDIHILRTSNQEADLQLSIERDSGHRTNTGQLTGAGPAAARSARPRTANASIKSIRLKSLNRNTGKYVITTATTVIVLKTYVAMPPSVGQKRGSQRGMQRAVDIGEGRRSGRRREDAAYLRRHSMS